MQHRRILITGGSQGIGAALVQHARKAGHQVVFTGRNEAHIQSTATATGAHGIKADVSSDADNARVVDEAASKMGGIDVLINNAGTGYNAEIGSLDVNAMRNLFATNVFGMVDITNRVVPMMKAQAGRRHRQHRLDIGHERREGRHRLRRQQVGGARHQPMLAGGARPLRHSRREHPALGSADELDGQDRPQQPEQALRRGHRRDNFGRSRHARRVLWPELAVFANNPWKED